MNMSEAKTDSRWQQRSQSPVNFYNLSVPISSRFPSPAMHGPIVQYQWFDHKQGQRVLEKIYGTSNGLGLGTERIEMPVHVGTHMDAACHYSANGRLGDGSTVDETERRYGSSRLSIEKANPLVGPGVLLDVAAYLGRSYLDAGEPIDAQLVEQAATSQGVIDALAGAVVLIRTGWLEARALGGPDLGYLDGEPGISSNGCEWLIDRGVVALGSDNHALEVLATDAGEIYPVHVQCLLAEQYTPILENVNLTELSRDAVYQFYLVAAPVPLVGASGAPIVPIAFPRNHGPLVSDGGEPEWTS